MLNASTSLSEAWLPVYWLNQLKYLRLMRIEPAPRSIDMHLSWITCLKIQLIPRSKGFTTLHLTVTWTINKVAAICLFLCRNHLPVRRRPLSRCLDRLLDCNSVPDANYSGLTRVFHAHSSLCSARKSIGHEIILIRGIFVCGTPPLNNMYIWSINQTAWCR